MSTCYNNPEKSSTTKINLHSPLVIYCSHIVRVIQQKITSIVIVVKTVWKAFVRI